MASSFRTPRLSLTPNLISIFGLLERTIPAMVLCLGSMLALVVGAGVGAVVGAFVIAGGLVEVVVGLVGGGKGALGGGSFGGGGPRGP